jgi:signal transduction histidine kinase
MKTLGRLLVDASLRRRSRARTIAAWVLAVIGPVLFALILLPFRSSESLASVLLCTLLVIIVVSAIGGPWPAITAACVGFLANEFFFTPPYNSLGIGLTADRVAAILFLAVGVVVGTAAGTLINQLAALSNEQAALRRVATLVALAAPAEELFAVVTEEVGDLLAVDIAIMHRFGGDGSITVVGSWSRIGRHLPLGARYLLEGDNISTRAAQKGGPVRMNDLAVGSGPIAVGVRESGARSGVGAPIMIAGRPWGVMIAASTRERHLPRDTEVHLVAFTDLVATAIANAESQAELAASRGRVVASADEARRRIERDLHDGAQQRLVSLGLDLRAAQTMVPPSLPELNAQLALAAQALCEIEEELQDITRGVHPPILSAGGLGPAIKALARRSALPVEFRLGASERLPERLEVAAYFIVSEAITNAVKHSRASQVHVDIEVEKGMMELSIRDDGIGGADPTRGSGLIGLSDRVKAFGGSIEVTSAVGVGTHLHVAIPVGGG